MKIRNFLLCTAILGFGGGHIAGSGHVNSIIRTAGSGFINIKTQIAGNGHVSLEIQTAASGVVMQPQS